MDIHENTPDTVEECMTTLSHVTSVLTQLLQAHVGSDADFDTDETLGDIEGLRKALEVQVGRFHLATTRHHERFAQLETLVNDLTSLKDDRTRHVSTLEATNRAQRTQSEQGLAAKQAELDAAVKTVTEIEQELSRVRKQNREEICRAKEEHEALRRQNARAEEELRRIRQQNEEQKDELRRVREEVQELRSAREDLVTERSEHTAANARLADVERQFAEFRLHAQGQTEILDRLNEISGHLADLTAQPQPPQGV